jgi:hypothetical protein
VTDDKLEGVSDGTAAQVAYLYERLDIHTSTPIDQNPRRRRRASGDQP